MIERRSKNDLEVSETNASLQWDLRTFDELTRLELYAILAARIAVFVVEQDCPYPELDGRDAEALHLTAWLEDGTIAAYARILPPNTRFDEPSIGRILTAAPYRRTGLGRILVQRAIEATRIRFRDRDIRISAQRHLGGFYAGFGFNEDSEPYDEDGIAHVDMRLSAKP
jgi:ElaA protein